MNIPSRLKEARKASGCSRSYVANRMGCSIWTIRFYEWGWKRPTLNDLSSLGIIYRQCLSVFFGDEPIKKPTFLWCGKVKP